MPHTPTRTPDQCREVCCCGNPCVLCRRTPHMLHVCGASDCVCHNRYHARVAAWLTQHYFSPTYSTAIASYRQWQVNPVRLEGPVWVRANGERVPANPQPQG